MPFIIGRGFAEVLIPSETSRISSPEDCKMPFAIRRGFAEVQIVKQWNWSYVLKLVEYFDDILHTRWYWQDLAQGNAKFLIGLGFAGITILKQN